RASNSATSRKNRHVPAARCAASSQIRSSSRPSGTPAASGSPSGPRPGSCGRRSGPPSTRPAARPGPAVLPAIGSPETLNASISIMYSMLVGSTDIPAFPGPPARTPPSSARQDFWRRTRRAQAVPSPAWVVNLQVGYDRLGHAQRVLAVREVAGVVENDPAVEAGEVAVQTLGGPRLVAEVRAALDHERRAGHLFGLGQAPLERLVARVADLAGQEP